MWVRINISIPTPPSFLTAQNALAESEMGYSSTVQYTDVALLCSPVPKVSGNLGIFWVWGVLKFSDTLGIGKYS